MVQSPDVGSALRRLCESKDIKNSEAGSIDISESNKEAIKAFDQHLLALNRKPARRVKCIDVMRYWIGMLGMDFRQATEEDLKRTVATFNSRPIKESTKDGWKSILKQFYIFLEGKNGAAPEKIAWLKSSMSKHTIKLDSHQLLTREDIEKIVGCADNVRDRFLVRMMYESGCRPHEILKATLGDFLEDKHGLKFKTKTDTKTGERVIRLIDTVPLFREYLLIHPKPKEHNAPLLYSFKRKQFAPMSEVGFQLIWKRIRVKAQKAYPELTGRLLTRYGLRKSRLTELAALIPEHVLKRVAGWTVNSAMASHYVALSGNVVDDAMLTNVYGMKKEEVKRQIHSMVKTCTYCKAQNDSARPSCTNCHKIFYDAAIKQDTSLEEMQQKMRVLEEQLQFSKQFMDKDRLKEWIRKDIENAVEKVIKTARFEQK